MKKSLFFSLVAVVCLMANTNAAETDPPAKVTYHGDYSAGSILWGLISWARCNPSENVCYTIETQGTDESLNVGDVVDVTIHLQSTGEVLTREGEVVNITATGEVQAYVEPN